MTWYDSSMSTLGFPPLTLVELNQSQKFLENSQYSACGISESAEPSESFPSRIYANEWAERFRQRPPAECRWL